MAIKILIGKLDGKTYDISDIISNISWSGDINSCSRKLEFSALDNLDIPLSSVVTFLDGDKELFKGYIFERDKTSSSKLVDYLAYDVCEKLNNVKASYNIKNKTCGDIANMILKDYGLGIGSIANGTHKVKKVFIGTSLYEIIQTSYTEQSKKDSKKYMTYAMNGKINVIEKGITKLKVKFEEGQNIIDSNFKESVSNMVNKVIIVDDAGNKRGEVKDDSMIKVHGLFQEVYKIEEGKDSNAEAKALLKDVEKTCSLTGFGDTTCITGYGVEVKDTSTNLIGLFYIDADTHTWEDGKYSIDLTLNFRNIMHEVNAGNEEENQSSSTSGTTVTGGKEYPAEFSAYYPANNSMQGGLIDAMGNKLDPNKLTCACPKNVPFKTKIQVKGTGTSRDNLVYTCTDRGGRIVVENGVYKIDLLMATKEECYNFGRRKGKVVIGVETSSNGNSSSGGSSNSDKLLNEAKKHLGKKYVWGATGPSTFDCSGLTSYVYKKSLGITIPRTSSEQRKAGKNISKSNVLIGDIVCFDGHVGIYAGDGQMIHAPNPQKPVKYDPCFSGYWGNKLLAIRRYW